MRWLCGMVVAGLAVGAGMVNAGAVAPGNATKGKAVFERRCTNCHALESNQQGPRLAGVVGRKAGTVEGFDYSDALKKSGIVWDGASLDQWLADPETMVPGSNMEFHVAAAGERADVVAFLRTQ